MEQRKLIKLGNSSFAIALPKNWINKSGLKKGDNIFLEENSNGEITMWSKLKKVADEKIAEIDISDKNASLIRKAIISAYTNGSTLIVLKGKKEKKELGEIKNFIRSLLSFEIIEASEERIIAKDFFNIEETSVANFIKRIDNNIKEMFSIINSAIQKGTLTKKELEDIGAIDIDTTKFYLLISRLFFKGIDNPSVLNALKKNSLDFFGEWWLSHNLEHLGDQVKEIAKLLNSSKIDENEGKLISKLFSQIWEGYNSSIQSFYKKDRNTAIESATRGKEIIKCCEKMAQHKNPSLAKLGIIFKELETNSYQNLKMVMYSRI